MRVAPKTEAFGFAQILVADIKAARIAYAAVNHNNLPVIAEIEPDKMRRLKNSKLAARGGQRLKESAGGRKRTQAIYKKTHLNPFPRFFR
jgi:hypothetical protein